MKWQAGILFLFLLNVNTNYGQINLADSSNEDLRDIVLPPNSSLKHGFKDEPFVCYYNEWSPEFPGGLNAFICYLESELKQVLAAKDTIKKSLAVKFVIDTFGVVRNPQVLVSYNPFVDAEVLKVLKAMPKWLPARQNNRRVESYFNFRFQFPYKMRCKKEPIRIPDYAKLVLDQKGGKKGITVGGDSIMRYSDTLLVDKSTNEIAAHKTTIAFKNESDEYLTINSISTSDPCIITTIQNTLRAGETSYFTITCPNMSKFRTSVGSIFRVEYNSKDRKPLEFSYRIYYSK